MKPLVKRQYILPFVLITSLFFLWGAAHSILDVLNKHFQTVIPGMNHAHSSMVQVMFYLGYFVMAIPAGILIDRRGYRTGVVAGLLLYGFGALLFWPGAQVMSFNFFLVSLFIIACGLVFLETAANPYVTELGDRETAPSRLNLAQSFNGLGCVCGPLFGGLLLFSDGGGNERIALPYVVMAVVALLVAVVFTRVKLPEIVHADTDADAGAPSAAQGHVLTRLFNNKAFMFGLFALFSYEVSEISINSFFINYVADGGWMTPRDASIALSFGGLGLFMLGRVVGSIVMQHVGSERVLRLCAIGTFATTFAVVLNLGVLSMDALVLVYVFESIMFPTIFALSLRGLGPLTKRASSLLMMTPVGGAVGPLLMGLVADASTMSVAFIVPLVGFANVAAFAFARSKHTC